MSVQVGMQNRVAGGRNLRLKRKQDVRRTQGVRALAQVHKRRFTPERRCLPQVTSLTRPPVTFIRAIERNT